MDVIKELMALRDATRRSLDRIAGVELDAATAEEVEKRRKLLADIEADIRRLDNRDAERP